MIKVNEIQTNNYLTKSKLPDADYVINPYIGCPHKCIYCYAEFMKRFTNHKEDWGDFIDIKYCKKPLNTKTLTGRTILFGSVTDAYNSFEKKYKITRNLLNQMMETTANIEILTKSDLVLRDIDILKQIKNIRVGISLNTLDDSFRKSIEPFAATIDRRLNTLKTLNESGISTYLFMSPIFPGITKFKEIILLTEKYCHYYCFENLNLRGAYLPRVLNFIQKTYPELVPLYDKIYKHKSIEYWEQLSHDINDFCKERSLDYKLYFYHDLIKK